MADLAHELDRLKSERVNAQWVTDDYGRRTSQVWRKHKERLRDLDRAYRGEFQLILPNGEERWIRPLVENIVKLVLQDRPSLANQVLPTLRSDPPSEDARQRHEKRERINLYYLVAGKIQRLLFRWYQDLVGAGVCYGLVFPDYNSGFPCFKRPDPRAVYPDRLYSPDDPPQDLIVAYQRPLEWVAREFPGSVAELRENQRTDNIEILEYYDSSEWIKVAAVKQGNKLRSTVLQRVSSRLSRPPFGLAALPSFDGEFRGVLDDAIPVLTNENRLVALIMDAAQDWVYSPIEEYDIENPEDYGNGQIIHKRSAQGSMQRVPPAQSNPQLFATMAGLRGTARASAVWPEARTGAVSQNIISAAGINSLVGTLSTAVATDQTLMGGFLEDLLSLAMEVDEKYLDGPKLIAGTKQGSKFSESYRPSKDIEGDYRIRVVYPDAGLDPLSREVRITQQVGNRLLSRRTAMERLSSVEDVTKEEDIMQREQLRDAALALVAQASMQGDPTPGIAVYEMLDKHMDPLLMWAELARMGYQPQGQGQAAAAAPAPAAAFSEAGAIARGGLPAPQENVPSLGALPPLEQLTG